MLAPISLPSGTPAGAAQTAAAPRATAPVRIAPVRSTYETSTRSISRDIGLSVALPDGHALWIFGDTGVYHRSGSAWTMKEFIDGSTALLVNYERGRVPRGAEYPGNAPTRFVPTPTKTYLPDGSGRSCKKPDAAFAARWPTGAAMFPGNDSLVLITYSIVCVTKKTKVAVIHTQGWGYELYDWRKHRIAIGPRDLVKPQKDAREMKPSRVFGQPIFGGGTLTMFSSACDSLFVTCQRGHVWSVTLPATTAALDNLRAYPLREVPTDGTAWQPLAITVGRFPSGLRLVETTSIKGTYRIYEASSIAGPWHLRRSGTLPGCPTKSRFCFAVEGHPELSTATQLFVSYKRPNTELPAGKVVVSAIPD